MVRFLPRHEQRVVLRLCVLDLRFRSVEPIQPYWPPRERLPLSLAFRLSEPCEGQTLAEIGRDWQALAEIGRLWQTIDFSGVGTSRRLKGTGLLCRKVSKE